MLFLSQFVELTVDSHTALAWHLPSPIAALVGVLRIRLPSYRAADVSHAYLVPVANNVLTIKPGRETKPKMSLQFAHMCVKEKANQNEIQ